MFTPVAMKRGALALLVAGTVAGAAEAQTISLLSDTRRTYKCSTGLFRFAEGTSSFHVTLDEYGPESGVYVVMRFINPLGTVVKSQIAHTRRGASVSLDYSGSGLLRVQAEVFEPASNLTLRGEPAVLASLSLNGTDVMRFIGPPIWHPVSVPCLRLL